MRGPCHEIHFNERLHRLLPSRPSVAQVFGKQLERRTKLSEIGGDANVVLLASHIIVESRLQLRESRRERRKAVLIKQPTNEVSHHARIVLALGQASTTTADVLVRLRHIDDDTPSDRACVMLRHIFAGADQKAPDWPKHVCRRIGLQPTTGSAVGVGLEDTNDLIRLDDFRLVVINEIQGILEEVTLALDVVRGRGPGRERCGRNREIAEKVREQLGDEALAGARATNEPEGESPRALGKRVQHRRCRGTQQCVGHLAIAQGQQILDDVAFHPHQVIAFEHF